MEKQQQKVAAVICEYNPFHHGHRHQIQLMNQSFDVSIGVMSGPFVQRGTVAVADKYSRAAAAVEGGLDLVVELPYPYCSAAAMDFAAAGVHIAAALGANSLVFGCEDAGATFAQLAALGNSLQEEAKRLVKAEKSLSYPRALSLAAASLGGAQLGAALSKPNNILGVEYVSAINRGGYILKPFPIQRNPAFASSSAIRAAGSYGDIPFPAYFTAPVRDLKYVERWLLSLMRGHIPDGLYGIDSELAATLRNAARNAASLEEAVQLATGKIYTAARVRRGILALWLGTTVGQVKAPPAYTLLLAANQKGTAYLKTIKKTCPLPIITKPAAYTALLADPAPFEAALAAEDAAALCVPTLTKYASSLCKVPNITRANV